MAKKWELDLLNPERQIRLRLNRASNFVLKDLDKWINTVLIKALVYGGLGIEGIAQTPFYKFVTRPDGLSQLGIPSSEPPKLLAAYEKSIRVKRSGLLLSVEFGDRAVLKLSTPHPAAGTGNLQIESWLEWVFDDSVVQRGYVPRQAIPKRAQEKIRLNAPLGGLMLPQSVFGSAGFWRFPDQYKNFEEQWLKTNIDRIQAAMFKQLISFLGERARRG